ncbi:flagellar export chaperone FliS [Rhodoferax sp. PAMC 29310]|uniref:flagellar export chaperone FliS n=1 Tax=Rhodoferax sp. PAMC 29310 TaxID=2822760 RepID=UPI001B31A5B9|nr:flagellar export chaperone FliS [Rhodoferax sp. PAMC 29310]
MFIPVHARAASAYQKVGLESVVNSSNPHQLTQLLFKALLQALSAARSQMVQGDVAGKCQSVDRALQILQDGLDGALDMKKGGEIARSLRALYNYCGVRLSLANALNDPLVLDEVRGLIEPIAQAWDQIRPAVN